MKRRIVVADDDPTIVTLVSLRLEVDDWEVLAAPTGEDALCRIRASNPQAVILDMQMPGAGGLAALEKIKADAATANVPVMMLTGERNPETVMKAVGLGAADYIVKPFNPDNLAERVARMTRNASGNNQSWEI